jgi:predicted DNA-binding protein
MTKSITLAAHVDAELDAELTRLSEATGRTKSSFVYSLFPLDIQATLRPKIYSVNCVVETRQGEWQNVPHPA